jgi:hypothetical protein
MTNKYYKTEVEGLVRDMSTNAILNVDSNKLEAYRKQKNFMNSNKETQSKIEKIENELNEIKAMLQQLVKR